LPKTDALSKLLIEKGIITQQEFFAKISKFVLRPDEEIALCESCKGQLTSELTRRREFNQASPGESS
jgi:hypothetical protein